MVEVRGQIEVMEVKEDTAFKVGIFLLLSFCFGKIRSQLTWQYGQNEREIQKIYNFSSKDNIYRPKLMSSQETRIFFTYASFVLLTYL